MAHRRNPEAAAARAAAAEAAEALAVAIHRPEERPATVETPVVEATMPQAATDPVAPAEPAALQATADPPHKMEVPAGHRRAAARPEAAARLKTPHPMEARPSPTLLRLPTNR